MGDQDAVTVVDGAARHVELWSPVGVDASGWEAMAALLGQRVRDIRIDRGWSQSVLAIEAGVHRNHVSNVERATNSTATRTADTRLSTICKIATALGVHPVDLLIGSIVPAGGRRPDDPSPARSPYRG